MATPRIASMALPADRTLTSLPRPFAKCGGWVAATADDDPRFRGPDWICARLAPTTRRHQSVGLDKYSTKIVGCEGTIPDDTLDVRQRESVRPSRCHIDNPPSIGRTAPVM